MHSTCTQPRARTPFCPPRSRARIVPAQTRPAPLHHFSRVEPPCAYRVNEPGKPLSPKELAAELDNKEAAAPRNHQAESSKRVHKRLYGIIAGLVLMLAVSMAGTFASSLVAIESAKDTVISADGAFVDKKTGALISTENPHFTTKAASQVQALNGKLDGFSSEVNVALRGQKG